MEAKRKCPVCHKPLNTNAKFCNFCGHKQPIPDKTVLRTDQKFFSTQELSRLHNELNEWDPAELSSLFTHSNKYLVALALEIFLRKGTKTSRESELLKHTDNENFLVCLLDAQPNIAELYDQLWSQAACNPWLVRKYLLWGVQHKYKLTGDAQKYLESANDAYLISALEK